MAARMIEKVIKLTQALSRHGVKYLFIGKGAAILYGYPGTTQDIDIFPEKSKRNCRALASALKEIGFVLDQVLEEAVNTGKDFIQIRGGPFPLDIVFAPDGIESFAQAQKEGVLIEGKFPCASLEDIIKSKKSAGRQRDRDELPRLEAFRDDMKKRNF